MAWIKRHMDWQLVIVLALAMAVFTTAVLALQYWQENSRPVPRPAAIRSAVR